MRIIFCIALLFTNLAYSNSTQVLLEAKINLNNKDSLRNGFRAFMQHCIGCHSTKLQRYSRIMKDLEIDDLSKYNKYAKKNNIVESSIDIEAAEVWFGVTPPDLTLTAKYRSKDWIYSYLKSFYEDTSRPLGVNNLVYPNTAMPNILENIEGIKTVQKRQGNSYLFKKNEGSKSNDEFEILITDITNFLVYSSEPIQIKRRSIGKYVLLFLTIFTILAWMLKKEYWKDIK